MTAATKEHILERFVTSATDPVYAITHNVPPEMFGAFGSYFSRNPKDFREHLWDVLTGQVEEEAGDLGIADLEWLVNGESREPAQALRRGLEKSQDFFRRWYGKYSHKSIANVVWIPMVATNVSQLVARELAYDQLAFFIEQSTRFVQFDPDHVYKDPDIMESKHEKTYTDALQTLAIAYRSITTALVQHYKKEIPFETWLAQQDERTQKLSRANQERKRERELHGKALDSSRYLLPQAARTNLAWILDARSTELDISAWKGHPLGEIREFADLVEKHAGQIAPSLLKYTDKSEYYGRKLRDYDGKLRAGREVPFTKGVDMISTEQEALDHLVAHLLLRHNSGGTFKQRLERVKSASFERKMNVLAELVGGRQTGRVAHDEWIELEEAFDMVKLAFEIRSDVGAIRDWMRHQKWDRNEPHYTLANGYARPQELLKLSAAANVQFDQAMDVAAAAEKKLAKDFPHQARYIVPMAANHTICMSAGADQLQYLLYTRTTREGNPSYREDAFNIAEAVIKEWPWLLGYREYPEGKSFDEVYQDAPFKGIINLDTRDTGLHQ